MLDWLAGEALSDRDPNELFAALCERLMQTGMPLLRAHLAMRTLHPLTRSVDLTWWRSRPIEVMPRAYAQSDSDVWLRSPFYAMLQEGRVEYRQRLDDADALQRFPLLGDLVDQGGTDYIAFITPFGDPATAVEREDGILTSWVTDAANGFSADDLVALRRLQLHLGLVAKLVKHQNTSRNVVAAYLGADAGARVLAGQIRLGDVERIPAVIWYCDLRDSTAMAERMPVDMFFDAVNAYFDCTAGAVLDHGGEVLRFIGDAVLAVFPITQGAAAAAHNAYAASQTARAKLAVVNDERRARKLETLAFGLALHIGEVLYGNIGVPSRLEFSVIGSAANTVCRIESLTKSLGEPLLVSREFCDALPMAYRDLADHALPGVGNPVKVFAPPLIEH